MFKKLGIASTVLGVLTVIYFKFVRPWYLQWGVTGPELHQAMFGDDLVQSPRYVTTRAITIKARPEDIWAVLMPIGATSRGSKKVFEANKALLVLLGKPSPENQYEGSWAWMLYSIDEEHTRLVSRSQNHLPATVGRIFMILWLEPLDFVIDYNVLVGIRRRAEQIRRRVDLTDWSSSIFDSDVP